MQVGVDIQCRHINFGGRGIFGFGYKMSQIFPFRPWSTCIVHRSEEIIESIRKYM